MSQASLERPWVFLGASIPGVSGLGKARPSHAVILLNPATLVSSTPLPVNTRVPIM